MSRAWVMSVSNVAVSPEAFGNMRLFSFAKLATKRTSYDCPAFCFGERGEPSVFFCRLLWGCWSGCVVRFAENSLSEVTVPDGRRELWNLETGEAYAAAE